ncbi:MAG: hypothetical protein HXY53_04855 [Nitrospirae bacterium]|nr:hypothetical protein [Nitrospirota bacterium]
MKKARLLAITLAITVLMLWSATAMASMDFLADKVLYGYYDIRTEAQGGPGLTDNYFTLTNTANDYVQSHIRVRTGQTSIELLDFDAVLSPHDVFTFDLYQDPTTNSTVWASCDPGTLTLSGFALNFDRDGDGTNDCYVLDSSTFPNMTSLIMTCDTTLTADEALAQTREGYVEAILEGNFVLTPTCTETMILSGEYLLYDWVDGTLQVDVDGDTINEIDVDGGIGDVNIGDAADNCPWDYPGNILFGRVYYVDYDPATVTISRMASQNAVPLIWTRDENSPLVSANLAIVHAINYSAEITRVDAIANFQEGWAYGAPDTTAPVTGADDMNYCTYDNSVGVINRVGAGATYGPTLADIVWLQDGPAGVLIDYVRDGTIEAAVLNVDVQNAGTFSLLNGAISTVGSHYWNYGSGTPGIPVTTFASTFPLKHFVDASIQVTVDAMYNNDEEECGVAIGKFISPGLPTAPQLVPEVNISEPLTYCPTTHIEGYIVWNYNVTVDEAGALGPADADHDTVAETRNGVTNYAPWVEAFSINSNDLLYSTTPMTVLSFGTSPSWI